MVKIHYRLFSFSKLITKYHTLTSETVDNYNSALMVKKTIRRLNKLPIGKNRCLVLSLVARKMLNRRQIDSTIHIGTQNNMDVPDFGHAWLSSCNMEIVEHSINHDKIAEF